MQMLPTKQTSSHQGLLGLLEAYDDDDDMLLVVHTEIAHEVQVDDDDDCRRETADGDRTESTEDDGVMTRVDDTPC